MLAVVEDLSGKSLGVRRLVVFVDWKCAKTSQSEVPVERTAALCASLSDPALAFWFGSSPEL